jgi:hypothetical protein
MTIKYNLYHKNVDYRILEQAFKIVEHFIRTKKRVLTGGMAIDFALRLKGDKLYDELEVPDYDFFSPSHKTDAEDLLKQLERELDPKPYVDIVNAIHSTTLRVRVNFNVVADITFIPESLYKNIKTLVYESIVIEHPYHKYKSQHLAFCYPYLNPPREVIMHRWKKDAIRHDLLYKYYPIEDDSKHPDIFDESVEIPISYLKGKCVSSFLGYKLHKQEYKIQNNKIVVDHPPNVPLVIFDEDHKHWTHNAEVDYLPRTDRTMYNSLKLFICETDKSLAAQPTQIGNVPFYIATLQHSLMCMIHFEFYDLYELIYEYTKKVNGDLHPFTYPTHYVIQSHKRIRYPNIDFTNIAFKIDGKSC